MKSFETNGRTTVSLYDCTQKASSIIKRRYSFSPFYVFLNIPVNWNAFMELTN